MPKPRPASRRLRRPARGGEPPRGTSSSSASASRHRDRGLSLGDTLGGGSGIGSKIDRPKRRARYAGTHPKKFADRYKELDPAKFPEVVERVIASGRTPAGSHLPIMVAEVLQVLAPAPGQVFVDATLGHGGHAQALVDRLRPGGRLLALDVDPLELPRTEARLRAAGYAPDELIVSRTNYASVATALAAANLSPVQGVLADLGCSSMQYDDPTRGFTYKHEGPLDLRMNPNKGQPASALLARLSERELADLLRDNSDEPLADPLARAIKAAATPRTTTALAALVKKVAPRSDPRPTLARVFQALRIGVNDELATLELFLRQLPDVLAPGGRACILTFHSGEDRRVKLAFRAGLDAGRYARVAEEPLRPTSEETRRNPRARPAKLRWAERAADS